MCLHRCLRGNETCLSDFMLYESSNFKDGTLTIYSECLLLANGCAHYVSYVTPNNNYWSSIYPEVKSTIRTAIHSGVNVVFKGRLSHFGTN